MNKPPDFDRFNRTVWKICSQVPSGVVTTYGQIASMIPCPDGVDPAEYAKLSPRWVGSAMNAVSSVDSKTIPWWRVINSKGGISLPAESAAGAQQKIRLKREGVVFDEKDLVDFAVCGWTGPAPDWLEAHGLLPPRSLTEDEPPDDGETPKQLSLF